jgi:hypothetical protein
MKVTTPLIYSQKVFNSGATLTPTHPPSDMYYFHLTANLGMLGAVPPL